MLIAGASVPQEDRTKAPGTSRAGRGLCELPGERGELGPVALVKSVSRSGI